MTPAAAKKQPVKGCFVTLGFGEGPHQQLIKMKRWLHTLVRLKVEFILPESTLQIIMAGCRARSFLDCGQPRKYMKEIYIYDDQKRKHKKEEDNSER